jgi:hypothetical protein
MKHLILILLCSQLGAQIPVVQRRIEIWDTSQRISFFGSTMAIRDTDGSLYTTLSDNVLTLNDANGAARVVAGGNTLDNCGYLNLRTGAALSETTQVDIRCSGITTTGSIWTLKNSSGQNRLRFDPSTAGWSILSTGGVNMMSAADNILIAHDAISGAHRAIIGGNAFGGCGVLTLKSGAVLSEVTQFDARCSGVTLADAFGSTRVAISSGGAIVSQSTAYGPSGFASGTGWTYFGGGTGSLLAMPSSTAPADGWLLGKVSGSNQIGWIAPSASGVSSVNGSGLISAFPTTGSVTVSCPNCANTNSGNFFNGLNVFTGTLRLTSGSETLFPISTSSYDLGTSARRWNTLYVGGINTAGFAGIGLVCFGGTYLFNPTFTNGILTSGSCAF